MKHLFTLLIALASMTAFCQTEKAKKDSISQAPAGGDTIKVDLLKYDALNQIRAVEQQKMEIAEAVKILQERSTGLDGQVGRILDAEYKHDPRYDAKRKILGHQVVGNNLVVVLEKLPAAPEKEAKKKPK